MDFPSCITFLVVLPCSTAVSRAHVLAPFNVSFSTAYLVVPLNVLLSRAVLAARISLYFQSALSLQPPDERSVLDDRNGDSDIPVTRPVTVCSETSLLSTTLFALEGLGLSGFWFGIVGQTKIIGCSSQGPGSAQLAATYTIVRLATITQLKSMACMLPEQICLVTRRNYAPVEFNIDLRTNKIRDKARPAVSIPFGTSPRMCVRQTEDGDHYLPGKRTRGTGLDGRRSPEDTGGSLL
ncbi:hypothetical protein B0J11DRAFT_603818 [Dendryphion nanum]|uniref:Uncharacterized protein n=1 Tax=Dendryphion nanum TaxID=256645 RepID=A0A9P9IN07_9PLEO|nr:hypothetical protein B0J11DRAFT_603818 [Dendryphion nanum]